MKLVEGILVLYRERVACSATGDDGTISRKKTKLARIIEHPTEERIGVQVIDVNGRIDDLSDGVRNRRLQRTVKRLIGWTSDIHSIHPNKIQSKLCEHAVEIGATEKQEIARTQPNKLAHVCLYVACDCVREGNSERGTGGDGGWIILPKVKHDKVMWCKATPGCGELGNL